MARRFVLLTVGLASAVAFLLGLIVSGAVAPVSAPIQTVVTHPPLDAARAVAPPRPSFVSLPGGVDFSDIAARIDDAVVNISATSMGREARSAQQYRPSPDGEVDVPGGDPGVPEWGAGSGFIIDPDGHILTNHHVIAGAERIAVTLADGRSLRARLVGSDPAIDVALVKVDASGRLPVAALGDSDDLRVGEWVCAIGNPFGYVHSVTVGVISFIGRKLFDPSLDDYIQTDAAINYGNSGGPLINTGGEVIGINSAISRRAAGIGFAIPINQVVDILPQLRTSGRVSRGFMGIGLIALTPDLQRSLGLPSGNGALVLEVSPGSPGALAGLEVYDLILSADGRDIADDDALIREISLRQPGSTVSLEVLRDAQQHTILVRLAERPAAEQAMIGSQDAGNRPASDRDAPPPGAGTVGLVVRDMEDGFSRRFNVPSSVRGVVVSDVDAAGPAYAADIRSGLVIMEVNRRPVHTAAEFDHIVSSARPGDALALLIYNPARPARDLIALTVDEIR